MSVRSAVLLVAALAAVGGLSVVAVAYHRRLVRALLAERAARRLTDALHCRDTEAFERRIRAAMAGRAPGCDRDVLSEADAVLDEALAAHRTDPEGGDR